jgi:hypothetical protein
VESIADVALANATQVIINVMGLVDNVLDNNVFFEALSAATHADEASSVFIYYVCSAVCLTGYYYKPRQECLQLRQRR